MSKRSVSGRSLKGYCWTRLGETRHSYTSTLGLVLLVKTVKTIEKDHRGLVEECKTKMLAAWLQQQDDVSQNGIPSWSVLRTALENIGEHQLASEIIT